MMRSGSLAANVDKKIDMYMSYTWDPALIIISSCNVPSLANLRRLWIRGLGFKFVCSISLCPSIICWLIHTTGTDYIGGVVHF